MHTDQEATLEALLARLADGDRSAFTRVFQLLWPPTLRLCSGLLKNEADAWDAAQLAMEKIFVHALDYDRSRPALPWALAIAAWECKTLLRKRLRRREVAGDAIVERMPREPEQDPVHRDLVRAALDAMDQLSPADRETLMATFFDETAGVSGAALRKRRQRALDRFKTTFRKLYGLD